ncbi:hypothetical protein PR003_g15761 [Phytophthora rubi]|uniref:Uncharacterized protein n=1 Tax=Phytophthora rubi TaxID=129364 RepID=A0A6A4EVI5_9STRA|nr:hypothetical protein PR003_g15761 [Phytophthora rubi]
MPVETAASSSVEPAVDAEVEAVMAAVLSAVLSASVASTTNTVVEDFNFLRAQAVEPLGQFLDFITHAATGTSSQLHRLSKFDESIMRSSCTHEPTSRATRTSKCTLVPSSAPAQLSVHSAADSRVGAGPRREDRQDQRHPQLDQRRVQSAQPLEKLRRAHLLDHRQEFEQIIEAAKFKKHIFCEMPVESRGFHQGHQGDAFNHLR